MDFGGTGGITGSEEVAQEKTLDASLTNHVLPTLGPSEIAAIQSPPGPGSLTLQSPGPLVAPVALSLTSSGDCSGVTFTITGTDENGNLQVSDVITGPNNETVPVLVSSGVAWWDSWNIAVSGACTNISAGASESLVVLNSSVIGKHEITVTGAVSIKSVFQAGWRDIFLKLSGASNFAVTFFGTFDFGDAGYPTFTNGDDFFQLNSTDAGTKIQIGYNTGFHTT